MRPAPYAGGIRLIGLLDTVLLRPAAAAAPASNARVIGEQNAARSKSKLDEIEKHAEAIEARLGSAAVGDDERQKLQAELRACLALRAEVEADLDKPITRDRDGPPH